MKTVGPFILIGVLLICGLFLISREGITTPAEIRDAAPDGPAVSACAAAYIWPLLGVLARLCFLRR